MIYNKNMEEVFRTIYEFIINLVNSSSMWGPLFACFLILIESILPVLPLFVFITVVFISYGTIIGFIVSWIFTILGCIMSYYLSKYLTSNWIKTDNKKLKKLSKRINKITFSQLVILIAIPFTPAFLVNIAAGLSKMDIKKYISALAIGKLSLVAFWGFIGTSLVESLKDPTILIKIVILVLIAYVLSKVANKKLKLT